MQSNSISFSSIPRDIANQKVNCGLCLWKYLKCKKGLLTLRRLPSKNIFRMYNRVEIVNQFEVKLN